MVWAWIDTPENQENISTRFDHAKSTLELYKLMGPEIVKELDGIVVVNAKRYKLNTIESYDCISCASPERVVSDKLGKLLLKFIPQSQFQLFPIKVEALNGTMDNFCALIPRFALKLTDISRSKINQWIVENEFTIDFENIALEEKYLGNLDIARDTVTNAVIISDKLKSHLDNSNSKGLYFVRGEKLKTWPY